MANAKELRKQIGSVKNTQKITRAMQMVAASKMRKAQERMARGRPYSDQIRSVISHMANASSEYPHQFMRERAVARVATTWFHIKHCGLTLGGPFSSRYSMSFCVIAKNK